MVPLPPDVAARLLGLIGLGVRGGAVSIGVDGTRALLQRRECLLVVVASDATQRVQDKVVRLAAMNRSLQCCVIRRSRN